LLIGFGVRQQNNLAFWFPDQVANENCNQFAAAAAAEGPEKAG